MGIKIETYQASKTKRPSGETSFLNREINLFPYKFSNKSKESFYSELGVLLKSGVNLKQSLDLISETQKKKKDKKLVGELSAAITSGSSLANSMQDHNSFTAYEQQAIAIAERTGMLAKITEDLSNYYQSKNSLKRQLISSLTYPIIVLITAVLVVIFMLSFVVPMFVDIFRQNRVELPWITQKIVSLSDLMANHGIWILLSLGFVILLRRSLTKKEWYYRMIGKLQLRIPIFGAYIKKVHLIQFTQAMALLTEAKIPVVEGIKMVAGMIRFYPLSNSLNQISDDIVRGERLHLSFNKHKLFPIKMIALLKVAEETNQTEFIFDKLNEQYKNELKYESGIISNVLNFLLTLLVGIIVGTILVAMYLPMFKLSSIIG